MAGRKKKELTEEVVNRRKRIGEELKSLRLSKGYTQKQMGDEFFRDKDYSVSVPTIRRWEKGEVDLPNPAINILQNKTGVIWEYWSGETQIKSREEYEKQKLYDLAMDQVVGDINNSLIDQYTRKIDLYKQVFGMCGYDYKCDADSLSWMEMRIVISGSDDDDYTVWHSLTPRENPDKQFYFTTNKLSAIFNGFKNIVDLACLRDNQNEEFCKGHMGSIIKQNDFTGGTTHAEEK